MRKYSYIQETGGNLTYVNTSIQTAHKEINNTHTHTHTHRGKIHEHYVNI